MAPRPPTPDEVMELSRAEKPATAPAGAGRMSASASAPALLEVRGLQRGQVWIETQPPTPIEISAIGSPVGSRPGTGDGLRSAVSPGSTFWGTPQAAPRSPTARSPGRHGDRRDWETFPRPARFMPDEMNCFKRVPTPSKACDSKAESYYGSAGQGTLRQFLADENWHTMPALKGKFFQHPRLTEDLVQPADSASEKKKRRQKDAVDHRREDALPEEAHTEWVLNQIYPPNPGRKDQTDAAKGDDQRQFAFEARRVCRAVRTRRLSTIEAHPGRLGGGSESAGAGGPSPQGSCTGAAATLPGQASSAQTPSAKANASQTLGQPPQTPGAVPQINVMLNFRKHLLERFTTVPEAFASFAAEFHHDRDVSKKEWRRVLSKQGFLQYSNEERDAIFDQIDSNGEGHISASKFHDAIEKATPVRTLDDLRRRWLATGYSSMAQAIAIMDDHGQSTKRRLSLQEFGEVLCRVYVSDPAEHQALFNAIHDPNDRHARVSIGELGSAVATVSPMMMTEHFRTMLKRYHGGSEKLWWDIDHRHTGAVGISDFAFHVSRNVGTTELEGCKLFRNMDVDGSGVLSSKEFMTAIALSDPSISLEDLRRKIRQRFRSIHEAIVDAFKDSVGNDLSSAPELSLDQFQDLLQPLKMSEVEVQRLFQLIDTDGDGSLSVKEWMTGIKHFAPSCILEDLRQKCLQRESHIADVFASIVDRTSPIDFATFTAELDTLTIYDPASGKPPDRLTQGLDLQAIFDLLDVKSDGLASISGLIAALQSGSPGSEPRLPLEELNLRAKQDIHACMGPMRRLVGDMKTQVRHFMQDDAPSAIGSRHEGSMELSRSDSKSLSDSRDFAGKHSDSFDSAKSNMHKGTKGKSAFGGVKCALKVMTTTPSHSKSGGHSGLARSQSGPVGRKSAPRRDHDSGKDTRSNSKLIDAKDLSAAPRLRIVPHEELSTFMSKSSPAITRPGRPPKQMGCKVDDTQSSWGQIWESLHETPLTGKYPLLTKDVHQYFQQAALGLSHDVPVLSKTQSRLALHQSVCAHERCLKPDRRASATTS